MEMALGAYPDVSLADARDLRTAAKAQLAKGLDPISEAKARDAERRTRARETFQSIAEDLIAKLEAEGRAEPTLVKKRWYLSLLQPDLGKRPVRAITASEILVPLRRIEADGNYETANRTRAFAGEVFRYAIATARADNDPTFGLRGALITPKVQHRAAIVDSVGFKALIRAIWSFEGSTPSTRAALQLMALLYPRPGELRLADWSEFDLARAIWTIPATRTKMRREHKKPLSKPALAVLEQQRQYVGGAGLVFPSELSKGKPISENTLNGALRRLGFSKDEMTSHGFRASASSLLNESGKWHPDAIEAELAHVGADLVRRAYHRSAYWEERVEMADWWGRLIAEAVG
jgi:integrase